MDRALSFTQPQFRGSVIKEYQLVIRPAGAVSDMVTAQKINFTAEYQLAADAAADEEILVARFLAKEEMEETILRWMQRILCVTKSFQLSLNNYGGLPGSNAIILRVQDHQPFKQLAKELKVIDELVKSNGLPKAQLFASPHLAFAPTLTKPVYEKAVMDYSKKEFHASFEVQEMILIKKTNSFDPGRQVSIFRLQP